MNVLAISIVLLSLNTFVTGQAPKKIPKIQVSDTQFLQYLHPLIVSGDSYTIAQSLYAMPFKQQLIIFKKLMDQKTAELNATHKEDILLYLLIANKNKNQQEQLLNIFATNYELVNQLPLLYRAAHKLPGAIVPIVQWLAHHETLKKQWVASAIKYALTADDPDAVAKLVQSKTIVLTPQQATNYLWQAVTLHKNPGFVSLLLDQKAQSNDQRNGKTPLIEAVIHNDKAAAHILIKGGAQVNLIADPAVGSALQIAIRNGFTEIELMLREHGARE